MLPCQLDHENACTGVQADDNYGGWHGIKHRIMDTVVAVDS